VTPESAPTEADGAQALRAALRAGLTTALKARDPDALAALRTALAAIDNAEAVQAPDTGPPTASPHIAGARSGPGSTEVARQRLPLGELHNILRDQIAEHTREADRYQALGQDSAAQRLLRQARTLAAYLH
jgi:hypothetical protein